MTPAARTPQLRDRRFARVRRLTQALFVAAGALSALFVGVEASVAKPATTSLVVPSTTTPGVTTTSPTTTTPTSTGSPTTTVYTPPTTVPVTTTTVCYSTPSGNVSCY
jgi:hypothetical protein